MTDATFSALCFDIGLKRTGVASGQSLSKTTQTAGQLLVDRGRHDWAKVDKLITEWQPQRIVIGDPHSQDAALNKAINRFKSHIQQQHKLPIVDFDERLSSNAANHAMQGQHLSQQKKTKMRDQVAACLILESYFNSLD